MPGKRPISVMSAQEQSTVTEQAGWRRRQRHASSRLRSASETTVLCPSQSSMLPIRKSERGYTIWSVWVWRRVGVFVARENLAMPSMLFASPREREKSPMLPIAEEEESVRVQERDRRAGKRKRDAWLFVARETEEAERNATEPSLSKDTARKSVRAEAGWMCVSMESYLGGTEEGLRYRERVKHSSWRMATSWDCMEEGERRTQKRSVCCAF